METYENEFLRIKYSEKDRDYINYIIKTLSENFMRIMNFFKLNSNFDNIKSNYSISYTIGNYLFEHYGNEYIYNLITGSDNLENQLSILFSEAKEWSNSKVK